LLSGIHTAHVDVRRRASTTSTCVDARRRATYVDVDVHIEHIDFIVAFTHRTSTYGGCRRNRTGPVSAAIWRASMVFRDATCNRTDLLFVFTVL